MLLLGVCFVLYFIKLSAGKGYCACKCSNLSLFFVIAKGYQYIVKSVK